LGLLILGVYTPLAAYLFRAAQHTGDGAAYTLQATGGPALDRAVHAGWLVPLSGWTRALHGALEPSAATNLASALAMGGALLLLAVLGRDLARDAGGRGADGLIAPAVALCSVGIWDAALFCEVYGPLSLLTLAGVLALRRGRPVAAGCLLFLAAATHPGALALFPAALVLGARARGDAGLALGVALGLVAAWVGVLGAEPWLGPRGLLAPGADVHPWGALQRAWRLLSRDLGISSLPLLVGALLAWTRRTPPEARWLLGCGLALLGTALGLDRFSDNPATLPLLLLCCPLAALAPSALRHLPPRAARAGAALLAIIVVLGIAEATSQHDAVARAAVRAQQDHARACAQPDPAAWRDRMLRELACLNR